MEKPNSFKKKKIQANFGKKIDRDLEQEFILLNVPGTAIGDHDNYHFNLIKIKSAF